ncbi:MAG: glycosyltransferase [Candidatus Eisenbacteria bacterium]|nr:glycosyltransferase [Candidatus Eisenbacteria bacterium]
MLTPSWLADASSALVAAAYTAGQLGLLAYASHRWWLIRARSRGPVAPAPWWRAGEEPAVLVQLPVRDEAAVVGRLVAAVAALDWPRDRLRVQLLDDSGEAVAAVGADAVARARAAGLQIEHVRRGSRHGFKAGALAHGLLQSSEPYVAVFDADFVPAPDFLRRMLPHLADSRVGLVQARWGHLDRDAGALSRAQAVLLDAHLYVEQTARQGAGCWFNFNGTAGVWRRACIEHAGGWQHDTLTEDLDLSYRAQLAGWRFVFDPGVEVPAELPQDMRAFRSQQHRWVKGAFQTARKLLPRVWAARIPARLKLEATVHLTANLVYPLLLVLLALMAPLLMSGERWPVWALIASQVALFGVGTLPVVWFLAEGQRRAGRGGARTAADVALALVLCGGLAWSLTRAVAEGLWGATGEFVRTPKWGGVRQAAAAGRRAGGGMAELAGTALCATLAALAWLHARPEALPFLLAFGAGSAWVGLGLRRAARTA